MTGVFKGVDMSQDLIKLGKAYYEAMAKKDAQAIEKMLHDEVSFLSPMGEFKGKIAVFSWVKGFLPNFESLHICSVCSNEKQAMVAYDIKFPGLENVVRGAALLSFSNNLIKNIELFFDKSGF